MPLKMNEGIIMASTETLEKCLRCGNILNNGYLIGGGLGIAYYKDFDGRLFSKRAFTSILDYFKGKALCRKGGLQAKACESCREISFKY